MTRTFWQGINKRFILSNLHSNKSLGKQFVQKLLGIFGRNHSQFTNLEINQYFYYTMATVFKVSGWCNNKINYHGNIFGLIKLRSMPILSFTYNATRNVITTYLLLFHVFLEQKQSKDSKTSRTKPNKEQ